MNCCLRCLISFFIFIAFFSVAPIAHAAQQDEEPSIDILKSSVIREGLYINDLTQTLAPILTDNFLLWVHKHDAQTANLLRAILAARVKEVTLLWTDKDFLLDLELSSGDTEMLTSGDTSHAAMQKALGEVAAGFLAELGGMANNGKKEVAKGVYQIDTKLFYAVAGKRVLVGSSSDQVEVSRNKMLTGGRITAVPDLGQHIWSKTDVHISCAPSAAGPYSGKKLSIEYSFFKTDQGWEYRGSHNYSDIVPALAKAQPITMQGLPFFGNQDPVFAFFVSGSFLDAIAKINFKDLCPPINSLIKGSTPYSLADISRFGIVFGGVHAQLMGIDLPGAYCIFEGSDSALTILQSVAQALIPGSWREQPVAGWSKYILADVIKIESASFPFPTLIAKRGNQLIVGALKHTPEPPMQETVNILQAIPSDTKGSTFLAYNISGFWKELRQMFKPGGPVRAMSELDSHLSRPQAEALDALFASEPPVKQAASWTSPDFSESKGHIVLDENPQAFIERLCALIDLFYPPQS